MGAGRGEFCESALDSSALPNFTPNTTRPMLRFFGLLNRKLEGLCVSIRVGRTTKGKAQMTGLPTAQGLSRCEHNVYLPPSGVARRMR
jgi:hypothetical protein